MGGSTFGTELYRDYVLPSILGKHEEDILYWAGKDLARKFSFSSLEDAISFFERANWGKLRLEKQSKEEFIFILEPFEDNLAPHYRLQAGILARTQEKLIGFLTECLDEKQLRNKTVKFILRSDLKHKME